MPPGQPAGRLGHHLITALGGAVLASVGLLLASDAAPAWFPARAHDLLASLPLMLAATLLLARAIVGRTPRRDIPKALGLAAAFGFWAAGTWQPHSVLAPAYNDAAIALFAVDVFLVIVA